MTATAHALVGAAIATHTQSIIPAVTISFLLHFIMDCVPHWDVGTHWRNRPKWLTGIFSISDTLLGITLAYFIFREKAPFIVLLASVVAAELPDWLEVPWFLLYDGTEEKKPALAATIPEKVSYKIFAAFHPFHTRAELPLGALTQIVTVGIFFYLTGNI